MHNALGVVIFKGCTIVLSFFLFHETNTCEVFQDFISRMEALPARFSLENFHL